MARLSTRLRIDVVLGAALAVVLCAMSAIVWWLGAQGPFLFLVMARTGAILSAVAASRLIVELLPSGRLADTLRALVDGAMVLTIAVLRPMFAFVTAAFAIYLVFILSLTTSYQLRYILPGEFAADGVLAYFGFVMSLVLHSYAGRRTVGMLARGLMYPQRHESWHGDAILRFDRINNRIDYRMWALAIATVVYIAVSIERVAEADLFGLAFWIEIRHVALEALLTFLAIDRFVSNWRSRERKATASQDDERYVTSNE